MMPNFVPFHGVRVVEELWWITYSTAVSQVVLVLPHMINQMSLVDVRAIAYLAHELSLWELFVNSFNVIFEIIRSFELSFTEAALEGAFCVVLNHVPFKVIA